jgi:hypothetical protein
MGKDLFTAKRAKAKKGMNLCVLGGECDSSSDKRLFWH